MMYSSTAAFLPRQQLNCIEKPRGSETTIYIQCPEAKAIVRDMSKSHVSRAVIGRRLSRGTLLAFVCIMVTENNGWCVSSTPPTSLRVNFFCHLKREI